MKEQDSRIAIRLPSNEKEQLDKLVEAGQFKNLSHAIRAALQKFLEERAGV